MAKVLTNINQLGNLGNLANSQRGNSQFGAAGGSKVSGSQAGGSPVNGSKASNPQLDNIKATRAKLELVAQRFKVAVPQWALEAPPEVQRQYIPSPKELETAPFELQDPIGDGAHQKCEGLIHRYDHKVLLMPTYRCGVYCRFCFRRHKVGSSLDLSADQLAQAFSYIKANPQVTEVILSGGDPLLLATAKLKFILEQIRAIGSVAKIRIHTKMPVALPTSISAAKIAVLANTHLVIHCNSAAEITPEAKSLLARLKARAGRLRSQSVLLKGVNDSPQKLFELFKALVANGVSPYYLHHPDKAEGTNHFRVSVARGRRLVRQCAKLGAVMPKYVLDLPGGYGKVGVLEASKVFGGWQFLDRKAAKHFYKEPEPPPETPQETQ